MLSPGGLRSLYAVGLVPGALAGSPLNVNNGSVGQVILGPSGNGANIQSSGASIILTAGASFQAVLNGGTGTFTVPRDFAMSSYTDDSANPGNRTVNTARGKNAFAIAAATCVITNSFVTTNSQIICTMEGADATLTTILRAVPAAGSFTVTGNAAATAATKFSWIVIN